MTSVMDPVYGYTTGERPFIQSTSTPASAGPSRATTAERLGASVPLVAAEPDAGAVEGLARESGTSAFGDSSAFFTESNALLARWGMASDGSPLQASAPTKVTAPLPIERAVPVAPPPPQPPAHYAPRHAAKPAPALVAAVAPVTPVTTTPEPLAVRPAPVAETVHGAEGASTASADLATGPAPVARPEEPATPGHAGTAVTAPEEITPEAAYNEALVQLRREDPRRDPDEARELAKLIADQVMRNEGHAVPEAPGSAQGGLRNKALELWLQAGVAADLAHQAAANRMRRPERTGLRLALGALGIMTTAAIGLYFIHKNIKHGIDDLFPAANTPRPGSAPATGPNSTTIAGR